ncbi:hypothetical protein L1887_55972 [Cichorium endivia]|nr:hypothetical protein L1887_55972 [Cichorium endivia]
MLASSSSRILGAHISTFAEAESSLVVPVPKRSLAARHCFHSPAARVGAFGLCPPPIHRQRNAGTPIHTHLCRALITSDCDGQTTIASFGQHPVNSARIHMSDRVRESIALPDYHDRSTEKQGRMVSWIERGLEGISPTEPCLPLSSSRSSALISDLTSEQAIRNIATGLASSHWSRPISKTELASLIDTRPPRASGSAKRSIHPKHKQTHHIQQRYTGSKKSKLPWAGRHRKKDCRNGRAYRKC